MRRFESYLLKFFVGILFVGGLAWSGSANAANVQSRFITRLTPDVTQVAHRYNLYPSVMMAQAALESDFGQSSLAVNDNNYYRMKGAYYGQSVPVSVPEYNSNGKQYFSRVNFKKYPNKLDSVIDNARLIRNGVPGNRRVYSGAWKEKAINYTQAADRLGSSYATDPNYSNYLIELIRQYHLSSLLDHMKPSGSSAGKKAASDNVAFLGRDYSDSPLHRWLKSRRSISWNPFHPFVGEKVYIDRVANLRNQTWYRIRFQRSQRTKYWVLPDAFRSVKPIYYNWRGQINAQQINSRQAFTSVLGSPLPQRTEGLITRRVYPVNKIAIAPHNQIWYQVKNRINHLVWVSANSKTQYLSYYSSRQLKPDYYLYALCNHVRDPHYPKRRFYSWSRVRLNRQRRIRVSRLAILRDRHNSFCYRFSNRGHQYWISGLALR